ncbi:MAG: hypothetical protein IJN54_01555 [Lachnospiraceae bacterium]|nr:hypothetical protein [Lachnospiraceae bacterium]
MLTFFMLLSSLVIYPKTERKLGFIQECVMYFLVVMSYGAVGAGIINNVKIPVNLCSMSIIYMIPAVILWGSILLKKKVQKLSISKVEVVSIILLSVVFLLIELKTFSVEMRAAYNYNTDAGNHLYDALSVVRRENVSVSGMYFAALYNGLTIEMFQPFLEEIKYYKGFVFADNFHYYFEMLFYYAVIFSVAKKKHTKYLAPVFTLLLWMGYPLYSYIEGHYVYWGWGAMLLCLIIYALEQYIEYKDDFVGCILKAVFGFVGVVLCYSLFAPLAIVAIGVIAIIEMKKKKIKIDKRLSIGILIAGVIVGGIAGYVYYRNFYLRGESIFESLKVNGGCYANLYTDFLWVIPIILIFFFCCYKKQTYMHVYGKVYLSFVGVQILLLVMFFAKMLSAYYYYKFYYPIWFLTWVLVAVAVDTVPIEKSERKFVYAYTALVSIVYISCLCRVPELLNSTEAGWISAESSMGTELYSKNVASLGKNFEERKYSSAQFEICEFVMENLRDTGEKVPFAGWWDCMGQGNWYRAITDMGNITRQMMQAEGDSWKELLEADDLKYYVVLKTSELYKENSDYFNELNWIFENEEGFVVQTY